MKLLVQGDDFGFTKGVIYGIVDAIDNGILRNTGLFANSPYARLAASFMDERRDKVCFGIDFNLVSGPSLLKKEDIHFRKEYANQNELTITLSDISFTNSLTIDLGNVTANIFHTTSPHSEDTVCVYFPEDEVLFLGDSTSEDFFNNCYMDKDKLKSLIYSNKSPSK